jgi:hypothetical protein
MTLAERLNDAHERARKLYLRRQDVQAQLAQVHQHAQALDLALVKSDGEIAVLEQLIAEQGAPNGV